ncbi:DNA repair protein RadA [Nakamurella sp. GG22]
MRSSPMDRTSKSAKAVIRPAYRCTECGLDAAKWHGRCPECQAWGSLDEVGSAKVLLPRTVPGPVSTPAQRIDQVSADLVSPQPSGLGELDRVLGGGLTPGAVVLLAGEPGVGKSTLLLSAAQAWASRDQGPVLIVSGEESAAQVRLRADRMGALHADIYLAAENDLAAVLGHIDQVRPRLLIVDSVQTFATAEVDGSPGGVSQVRAVAAALSAVAKERNMACVLVGHVTKDGGIAGPRVLEHLVDVVLQFEGDRHSTLRTIRGVKNRYGPSDEVGCFQMVADGIVGLADPSGLFLTQHRTPVPGTCATVSMQGRRAIPAELQTLITPASGETSRRTVSGLDASRTAMVIAVLQRWGGVSVGNQDVLAATVGGVKMLEPAADLPLAMAIWSSVRDIPLAPRLVVIGELGLAAEIRPVGGIARRLSEAARLGFDHAVVPAGGAIERPPGMRVDEASDLGEAFRCMGNDDGVVQWLRRRRG